MANRPGVFGFIGRGWQNCSNFCRAVLRAWRNYGVSGSPLMAAAIAFYSVVCIGPLGILLSGILKLIFGEGTDTYDWIQGMVTEYGEPVAGEIMSQVDGLLASPDQFYASAFSIAAVIWAGMHLFETVERSLTQIWPGTILRGFIGRKLISLGMMGVAGALLTAFMVANAFFARLHGVLSQFPEIDADAIIQAQPRIMILLGFVLSLLAFSLLYKFMPVQPVPKRAAFAGAVCAAVLWQAASPIFTYFMSRAAHNNAIYGGLAGVVLFALWAFLGAQVLLFGAHFAAAWQEIFLAEPPMTEEEVAATESKTVPNDAE
jgi:membrane protein